MAEQGFVERDWVVAALTAHRPGVLTAIGEVFASRGVDLEAVSASVVEADGDGDEAARVVGLFRASERRSRLLARTVGRLDVVRHVVVRSADDPSVHGAGIVRMPDGQRFTPADVTPATWTGDGSPERPLLVQGSLRVVRRVVAEARAAGATGAVTVVLTL